MRKLPLLASTLIAAVALSVPAWADISQNTPTLELHDNSGTYGFSIKGDGTAVISSDAHKDTPATMSIGSISGDGKAFVQLSGGGYLTISCSVTLENGGYINYQGSTTFTRTATLGSIEFYQEESTICDVVFSGSSANATVGTITVDESGGSLSATLTVENDATLKVTGGLTINDDFNITIDAGTMELGGSASGSKSASITIENGGQLSVTGDNVSLNNATIEIVLSEDNISGSGGTDVYALIGSGSISDVTIKITVDEALAELLASGGEYTFDIYESSTLTLGNNVGWDYSYLEQYGYNLNGDGTLTIRPLPEPSMFGFFFGLSAIGLTATRRRRRRTA